MDLRAVLRGKSMDWRRMRRLGMVAVVCAAASFTGFQTAHASILIDDFSEVGLPSPWAVTVSTVTSTTNSEAGLSSVIGGVRTSTVTGISFAVPLLDDVDVTVAPSPISLFDFRTSSGARGNATLRYDSGGIPGGLAADLSNEAGILIDLIEFDHGGGVDMPISISISDGTNSATLVKMLTSPGAQSVLFGINDFVGVGGVSLNSVDSIEILFDAQLAQDFRVDRISTITSLVPEPGALAVWCVVAAAAGLVIVRRRS